MEVNKKEHHKLSEWFATAICGNDISSSCLYVSVLSTRYGGIFSPIILLFVSATLYLYRKIYAEVGEALPLNGGTYNCLLNTTSKYKASIAACLTILSYIATCVISATTGISYLYSLHEVYPSLIPEGTLPFILGTTTFLLAIFAILTITGIGESATVALGIFVFHLTTLVIFSVMTGYHILFVDKLDMFFSNFAIPLSTGGSHLIYLEEALSNLTSNWEHLFFALFFGFSSALLGISGFESSADFIE